MRKRVLVVEDDQALARILKDNLGFEGFDVRCADDANAAFELARDFAPDLVLLDLTLPGRDGLELCGVLRQGGKVSIIILSARSRKSDKLEGLRLGADDYITKPFDMDELFARIQAVLRRARPAVDHVSFGPVHIDFTSLHATNGAVNLHLSHREFEVLRYLAERPDRVVHRNELLREIWGYLDAPPTTRSVDHAIARLRKKLEIDPHHPQFIHTVHGDGYRLSIGQVSANR